jgi:hypothetical protein
VTERKGPSLLVAINGNVPEWRATLARGGDAPRLPLPYAMGAACVREGFRLHAIDSLATGPVPTAPQEPFNAIYAPSQLKQALGAADVALLWGTQAVRAVVHQITLPPPRRRVIVFSYTWPQSAIPVTPLGVREQLMRAASALSRGVVLMTQEQVTAARRDLRPGIPVIHLRVGIDTAFYRIPGSLEDVDVSVREHVARFIEHPFAIMPGDELRLNDHALRVVERTSLNLVRISQYGYKSDVDRFKDEIALRGLSDRILVLEQVSYRTLRFLLQRASAYAGLVDATWQPAGWTVVCESLASGLPVVMYDGLASRELDSRGASRDVVRAVPMNDVERFARELESASASPDATRSAATAFAQQQLDLEATGAAFARDLRAAVHA